MEQTGKPLNKARSPPSCLGYKCFQVCWTHWQDAKPELWTLSLWTVWLVLQKHWLYEWDWARCGLKHRLTVQPAASKLSGMVLAHTGLVWWMKAGQTLLYVLWTRPLWLEGKRDWRECKSVGLDYALGPKHLGCSHGLSKLAAVLTIFLASPAQLLRFHPP